MTHNIEGHERSTDSCQKIISKFKPDFFLRQEDWLFGFQHFKLSQVNSNYNGTGVSVDCDNPVFSSGSEKAKWGLDILYTKEMNSCVTPLVDYSSQRIQVVKLSLDVPIILINVYLPATSLSQQEYDDALNQLSAVINNYEADAAIFLAGDFNRSLFRNNPGDLKFKKFCSMSGIIPAAGTTDIPSYHGYNGSSSKIDYVMMHEESCLLFGINKDDLRIVHQPCKEEDPTIISTHDPIVFELKISGKSLNPCEEQVVKAKPIVNKRLIWETADLEFYQETLETLLQQNFDFWNQPECINTLALLIPQAYKQAAEVSVQSKQNKQVTFKTVKSEDWLKAETAAVKASKKWIYMGKPRGEENTYFVAKKQTKLALNKAIKDNSKCIRLRKTML